MNKTELESAIQKDFPDINHTEFVINGRGVEGFVQQRLLPFLIYQNTVDSSSRLITLFLEENSPSMHFLPFYIAYGFYRKAIDRIFSSTSFRSLNFPNQQRQVIERTSGNVCSITSVNFINRSLTVRTGTGRVMEIPFEEDYRLNWNYAQSDELKNNIRKFEHLFSASSRHIFSVPLPAGDEHEGIVIFTQVSKFETLLHGVSISGQSLDENLHIEKTVFGKSDKISFNRISAKKTEQRPVTVLLSRSDSIRAYHHIISSDPVKYGRLNTVVIDDFDLLLSREIASGTLVTFLQDMDEVYFSRLGTTIRDIYLVCRDRNFNLYETLSSYYPGVKPWMLKPQEHNSLDGLGSPKGISIRHFRPLEDSGRVSEIEQLIDLWRRLSIQMPCQGELLPIISLLYGIREKLLSFFDPLSITECAGSLNKLLSTIQARWFTGGQDNLLIGNTRSFLDGGGETDQALSKLLRDSLGTILPPGLKRLIMVTNNESDADHNWLGKNWKGNINFINSSSFISGNFRLPGEDAAIIHLCWNRQIADRILTARHLPAQYFLLDLRGFRYLKSYLPKAWRQLCRLSTDDLRSELLNLGKSEGENFQPVFPGHISFMEMTAPETAGPAELGLEDSKTLPEIDPFMDFEQAIWQIVKSAGYNGRGISSDATKLTVYFQDGTLRDFTAGSWLYVYDEETPTLELQKEVGSLTNGDLVLLPKSRTEIRKLLEEVLVQDEFFAELVAGDHEWRKSMAAFLRRRGAGVEDLRLMLAAKHVEVVSPKTIQNWIDGETLEPRKFEELLKALSDLKILPSERLTAYQNGAKALKQQKSTFIRSAIRKLIYTMKGISYAVTDFDEELLNGFLDHIEMKKVLTVTADKYAN